MSDTVQAPSLTALEKLLKVAHRELDALYERASAERSHFDALAKDFARTGDQRLVAKQVVVAARLRTIVRLISIAQCQLVHPDDERFGAAVRTRDDLVAAQRSDSPWRLGQAA